MAAATRVLKAHYRLASGPAAPDGDASAATLEDLLRSALSGPYGDDFSRRTLPFEEASEESLFINNSDFSPPGVFLEVMHVEGRRDIQFLQRKADTKRVATLLSRRVADDEDALGRVAYLVVIGNHIASIETAAISLSVLQSYLNNFLVAAEQCISTDEWKLVPKVRLSDGPVKAARGVTRLEITPPARLVGDGPGRVTGRSAQSRPSKDTEERMARGGKVAEIMQLLGASEAELGAIRNALSSDLGLEARIQIVVRKNKKKTEATLSEGDIAQLINSLEKHNALSIVSPDGKSRQSLTTLWEAIEVDGASSEPAVSQVAQALAESLFKWARKSIIDLQV